MSDAAEEAKLARAAERRRRFLGAWADLAAGLTPNPDRPLLIFTAEQEPLREAVYAIVEPARVLVEMLGDLPALLDRADMLSHCAGDMMDSLPTHRFGDDAPWYEIGALRQAVQKYGAARWPEDKEEAG